MLRIVYDTEIMGQQYVPGPCSAVGAVDTELQQLKQFRESLQQLRGQTTSAFIKETPK